MKDIRQKLLATFHLEHRDHVEQIRAFMAMLGKTDAPPARPDIEEVFRRAHSLKGAARAVDLHPIEELAHSLEALFSRVLHGGCTLDQSVNRVVEQVLDASEDCIAAANADQPAETLAPALFAIGQVLGIETKAPAEEPANVRAPVPNPAPAFQPLEMVRITAENFESLFRTAGSLVAESQRQDHVAEELDRLARDIALIAKECGQAQRAAAALKPAEVSSRHSGPLTILLDSMEQRIHSVSRQARSARHLQQRRSWSLRQHGKQLRQDVWEARMVPAESLLDGYRKMMRDLARDEGREIEFRAVSAGVNADRRVLEALKDPIMHLLRNAVSHGIESASERTAKGKRPEGRVTLRIGADGQRLTVAIEDDGRGVDFTRVTEVAIQEGILPESAATADSTPDLTRLLFRPGFSTSAAVTNLSGRGMGLSVVYEAVRRLQGDLDLRPAADAGTAISLSVPLSIASHRLVIVQCGASLFAIPVPGIERLLRMKRSRVEMVEGRPIATHNGQPVSLTTIHAVLGLEQPVDPANLDTLQIVILRSGGQRLALAVDSVIREVDAVTQDLASAAGCGGRISSAVLMDDGSIAFVVNPMELVESALRPDADGLTRHAVSFVKPPDSAPAPAPSNILVVDDSMTTRALEKSILEAHGYHVRVAVDGVDALTRLRQKKADLVIADIEMPRLNGFGLLEAIKQDPDLRKIPVIIVSSLERREDQERGLSLGADAYVVKRKFDQEELLGVIRQIL